MNDRQNSSTPFVIWTMQRTGGTNFTNRLIRMSRYEASHEPFNRPRACGSLTIGWEETGDADALARGIDEILAVPRIIKHCVEMVPWRISATLADRSIAAGYKHLFLVRESSLDRLLSMEYAQRTKVWGPGREKPAEDSDPAFDKPLDVKKLVRHEKNGIDRLNTFWARLVKGGAKPSALSFEQLYSAPEKETEVLIDRLLHYLDLTPSISAAELLGQLREGGDQNTRDRYGRFEGIEALKTDLASLPKYTFS